MTTRKAYNFPSAPKVKKSLEELEYLQAELRRKRASCVTGIRELEQKIAVELDKELKRNTKNNENTRIKKIEERLKELRMSHMRNTEEGQAKLKKKFEKELGKKAAEIKFNAPEEYQKGVQGKYTLKARRLASKLPNLTHKKQSNLYEKGFQAADPIAKELAKKEVTLRDLEAQPMRNHARNLSDVLAMRPSVFKRALTNAQKKGLQGILDAYYEKIRELKEKQRKQQQEQAAAASKSAEKKASTKGNFLKTPLFGQKAQPGPAVPQDILNAIPNKNNTNADQAINQIASEFIEFIKELKESVKADENSQKNSNANEYTYSDKTKDLDSRITKAQGEIKKLVEDGQMPKEQYKKISDVIVKEHGENYAFPDINA